MNEDEDADAESLGLGAAHILNTIIIRAKTRVGAIWAMESLSQLIEYDFTKERYRAPANCMIKDRPRFPYRGLLVDTARHFIPVKNLKDLVVLLRMHKMN